MPHERGVGTVLRLQFINRKVIRVAGADRALIVPGASHGDQNVASLAGAQRELRVRLVASINSHALDDRLPKSTWNVVGASEVINHNAGSIVVGDHERLVGVVAELHVHADDVIAALLTERRLADCRCKRSGVEALWAAGAAGVVRTASAGVSGILDVAIVTRGSIAITCWRCATGIVSSLGSSITGSTLGDSAGQTTARGLLLRVHLVSLSLRSTRNLLLHLLSALLHAGLRRLTTLLCCVRSRILSGLLDFLPNALSDASPGSGQEHDADDKKGPL